MQYTVSDNLNAEGCTAPEIGRNLDRYELDMLDEGDKRIFEMHLFECPYCFGQIKSFSAAFAALRREPEKYFQLPVPVEVVSDDSQAVFRERLDDGTVTAAAAFPAIGPAPHRRRNIGERLIELLHSFREKYFALAGRPALAYVPALGLAVVTIAALLLLPSDTALKQDESFAARDPAAGTDKAVVPDTAAEIAPIEEEHSGGLYAQLAVVEAAPYVPMSLLGFADGEAADSLFHAGMEHYGRKQYGRAIRPLSSAAALSPGHAEANLYLGICRLLTGSAREALRPLSRAADGGEGAVRDKAHWYAGQAYLLLNDADRAREEFGILLSGEGRYAAEARKILKKIKAVRE